jgi:hypothetical protein
MDEAAMIYATDRRYDPAALLDAYRAIEASCVKTSKPNHPAVFGFALQSRDGSYTDGIAGAGGGTTVDGDFSRPTLLYAGALGAVIDEMRGIGRIARARLLVHRTAAHLPPHADGLPPPALNPERSLLRCHIPISPSADCRFTVGGVEAVMAEVGRLYFFPAWLTHAVTHGGATERVHLVFSYVMSLPELHAYNAGRLSLDHLFDAKAPQPATA